MAQQGKDLVWRSPCTLIVTLNTTKTHKHALDISILLYRDFLRVLFELLLARFKTFSDDCSVYNLYRLYYNTD